MTSLCCRLCLLSGSELQPILDLTVDSSGSNEPVTLSLSQLIVSYLSIQPLDESTIATYICSECRNTVAKWHWFRESCLQNDSVYQKLAHDPGKEDEAGQIIDYFEVEVKQELQEEVEIGEDKFNENLFTEPLVPLPNEKLKRPRGRPKKPEAEKSKRKKRKREGPPKKIGRPPLPESEKKSRLAQMCTICGKEVKNMAGHLRMHNQDRCYQCPHCPMNFYTQSTWKNHVNVHTKEVKFTCPVCDKFFWRNETLKMHMNSHSEERNFKCPYCPKAYSMRAGLVNHRKTHTQGPDIQCEGCDKKFYNRTSMLNHAVKHLAVKPFECKICQRGFTRKQYIVEHMKKAHPNWKEAGENATVAGGDSDRD